MQVAAWWVTGRAATHTWRYVHGKAAVALVEEGRAGSDEEIREFMSGNLCRCGAYPNIVAAIREAAGRQGE
jgi:aerobic-type carbon monoxide dehydrogenase small subunit (CoxS/CutS family)